jgi:hypothetical protein
MWHWISCIFSWSFFLLNIKGIFQNVRFNQIVNTYILICHLVGNLIVGYKKKSMESYRRILKSYKGTMKIVMNFLSFSSKIKKLCLKKTLLFLFNVLAFITFLKRILIYSYWLFQPHRFLNQSHCDFLKC